VARVVVSLREEERQALVQLALVDLRLPQHQARFILRQEFERRGLLPLRALSSPGKAIGPPEAEPGTETDPSSRWPSCTGS